MYKVWTNQELKALRGVDLNDTAAVTQLAKELGRTLNSVKGKAYHLNKGKKARRRRSSVKANGENVVVTSTHVHIRSYAKLSIIGNQLKIEL